MDAMLDLMTPEQFAERFAGWLLSHGYDPDARETQGDSGEAIAKALYG